MNPQIAGILNESNFGDFFSDSARSDALNELNNCSVLEFRGDTFSPSDVPEKLVAIRSVLSTAPMKTPKILLTLRLPKDGGEWTGSANSRVELWTRCIENDLVDWIDIEIEEIEGIRELVDLIQSNSGLKMMISQHNFKSSYTFNEFEQKLALMKNFKPDLVKFAVTLQSRDSFVEMLAFSRNLSAVYPLSCCISMGIWGKMSRIGSPLIGAPITYGFLGSSEVVSGQYSVKKLKNYIKLMERLIPKRISEKDLVSLLEEKINDE